INASGLYTAPSSIATQQSVTITVTSQADGTKSATATVTLVPPGRNGSGYSHTRSIVINHTKVPNTDQPNFPMLISGTYSYLGTATNGGQVQNPNGYDIIFTSDCAGTNQLAHEIESYNPATGAVALWVKIPNLSHTTDTTIYVWYGNPAISSSQENRASVWDSAYKGVWHLKENPAGVPPQVLDSTSNANHATSQGNWAVGQQQAGEIA